MSRSGLGRVVGVTGLTTSIGSRVEIDGTWTGLPGQRFHVLSGGYVDQLERAGAVPVCLTPTRDVGTQIAAIGALVLTGGEDVDPARYAQSPVPETGSPSEIRDRHEAALFAAARAAGLPVLLICRGMQLVNVELGGTLTQHIEGHDPRAGATEPWHDIELEPNSAIAAIEGSTHIRVNSYHHQAISRLGDGVIATGHAGDSTIEAVEIDGESQIVGVQWHPELMAEEGAPLFKHLVAASKRQ